MHSRSQRRFMLVVTLARHTSQLPQARRSSDCSVRQNGGANGSPNPEDICVERKDIDCRVDCHRRACSNWICMDIEVERVLRAVRHESVLTK